MPHISPRWSFGGRARCPRRLTFIAPHITSNLRNSIGKVMKKISRCHFLHSSAMATTSGAIALGFSGCSRLLTESAPQLLTTNRYGDLLPDPYGILDLPEGFTYHAFPPSESVWTTDSLFPALTMVIEPNDSNLLENADNVMVTP